MNNSDRAQPGLVTALIECLTVLLEYLDLLQSQWQGTAIIWEGLGPTKPTFGYATKQHPFIGLL